MSDFAKILIYASPLLPAALVFAVWRSFAAAMRALDAPEPDEAQTQLARKAGRALAARGPIGLVLAGGGAKGAYQVGCWKALRECGIVKFDAIAGTSVGALNAVLVAQDQFGKAEALWRDMSFGRVLRLDWRSILAVSIRIALIPTYIGKYYFPQRAIPVQLWRAVKLFGEGWSEVDPRLWLRAALDLYSAIFQSPMGGDYIGWLAFGALAVLGVTGWWALLGLPLVTIAIVVFFAPLLCLLIASYSYYFVAMLDWLSTRLALASNEPLRQLVDECADSSRLKNLSCRLFVTVAFLGEVSREPSFPKAFPAGKFKSVGDDAIVDPDPRKIRRDRDYGDRPSDSNAIPGLDASVRTVEYVPRYVDIGAYRGDMDEMIVQSAGLPEIFPARRIDGETYVDGGLADNVPVAALSGIPQLAVIVVVPLDHRADEKSVRENLSVNFERLAEKPPSSLPKLALVTPSRPLGNMFTGTLDFRASRARALMRLGYGDAIRALARLAPAEAQDG